MNISLSHNYPVDADGNPIPFQSQIDEHRAVMTHAGFNIVGDSALVPDPDPNYPGAYQIWSPIFDDEHEGRYLWVWIDPEGRAVYRVDLPTAQEMEDRA